MAGDQLLVECLDGARMMLEFVNMGFRRVIQADIRQSPLGKDLAVIQMFAGSPGSGSRWVLVVLFLHQAVLLQ